jgi:hypothetical protein
MSTSWEAELKRVDDLIADAERRIERQGELTQKLAASGLGDAERTLEIMMTILEVFRKIRIALESREPGRTRH